MAKVDNETLALSGLLALGGLSLIVYGLTRGGSESGPTIPTRPPVPGDQWGVPIAPEFEGQGQVRVPIGEYLKARQPSVEYQGPGRNAYTSLLILQRSGSQWATVYASGVAGSRMFTAARLTRYGLVAPGQPQPDGSVGPELWAYPWPGTAVGPICGMAPQPGPATAVLAVYGVQSETYEGCAPACPPDSAPDYDGFASPTCNPRLAVTFKVYPDKILFV